MNRDICLDILHDHRTDVRGYSLDSWTNKFVGVLGYPSCQCMDSPAFFLSSARRAHHDQCSDKREITCRPTKSLHFPNCSFAALRMSTTSSTTTTTSTGLPEDEYINKLIVSVEKRPVLYNVHLLDYKNKNKKGEAFKEVQQEMRAAGCSEQQGKNEQNPCNKVKS